MTLKIMVIIGLTLISLVSWYLLLCFVEWFVFNIMPILKEYFYNLF